MENLKKKIIGEIINQLTCFFTINKHQIKELETGLLNNDYSLLESYITNYYQETSYSKEFKTFVTNLVNHKIISKDYLSIISSNDSKKCGLEPNIEEDEFLTLESDYIKEKREKMLNLQISYLNNVNEFIHNLEMMNPENIYNTLINLNDIRFIQHSIAKLNLKKSQELLEFTKNKLKENKHNSINIFIEEAIKKNMHDKK